MKIHHLQHVPFEGLGSIATGFNGKEHRLSCSYLHKNPVFPALSDIDWLIVMGGPMGVHDETEYPWLVEEKRFIGQAIESGKTVLGICLGAQLIADVLGAKVYKNRHREIGWFDIERHAETDNTIFSSTLPQRTEVFHWHGETFDIPFGAKLLASSAACQNQGFILDNRVVGFQFHLETTLQSARLLVENCRTELDGSLYVQSETDLLADLGRFSRANRIMAAILDAMENANPGIE